jgi:hypothetical protein
MQRTEFDTILVVERGNLDIRVYYYQGIVRSIEGVIMSKPVPKASVRLSSVKGRICRYLPTHRKTQDLQGALVTLLEAEGIKPAGQPLFPPGVPMHAHLTFHLERPKTEFTAKDRLRGLAVRARPPCFVCKPDLDNLAKFFFDVCNKVVYQDDQQICSALLEKRLDSEGECLGRTCFRLALYP